MTPRRRHSASDHSSGKTVGHPTDTCRRRLDSVGSVRLRCPPLVASVPLQLAPPQPRPRVPHFCPESDGRINGARKVDYNVRQRKEQGRGETVTSSSGERIEGAMTYMLEILKNNPFVVHPSNFWLLTHPPLSPPAKVNYPNPVTQGQGRVEPGSSDGEVRFPSVSYL